MQAALKGNFASVEGYLREELSAISEGVLVA